MTRPAPARGSVDGNRLVWLWAGFALLLLGLSACAEDLGREWQALDAESSAIVFAAPGLEDRKARYMRSYNDRQSLLVENAMWTGPEARHAKAIVQYFRTSPGYHFPTRADPQDLVQRYSALKDKTVTFGALKSEVNGLGRVSYRSFGFDGVNCVVFRQLWGASAGAGDRQIVGYYCADPGQPLGEDSIKRVVRAIDVR